MKKPDIVPKLLQEVRDIGLYAVCMAKRDRKYYVYMGQRLNCKQTFDQCKKRRGRSKYLLSVNVLMPYQPEQAPDCRQKPDEILIPIKLIYVRNRNKPNEYLLLFSTDQSLSEKELIALYGKH